MIEEIIEFEKKEEIAMPQLSSRTMSFYGTHQRENKSKILYTGGNEFLIHSKHKKLKAKYIFHVCFQLTTLIDYVRIKYIIFSIFIF